MTQKHTQFRAPFHVEMNDEPDNQNKGTIHIIDNHGDLIGTAIDEKIARTFAAAPDLLEALKGMLAIHKPDSQGEIPSGWPDAARAAIAKAEGR